MNVRRLRLQFAEAFRQGHRAAVSNQPLPFDYYDAVADFDDDAEKLTLTANAERELAEIRAGIEEQL